MAAIKTTLAAFALTLAIGAPAAAHQVSDHCHDESSETRRDMLGALKDRQIENAREEGRAEQNEASARDRLRDRVVAEKNEQVIDRLESENERLRAVLVALGVDPERMLRLTERK